MTVRQRLAALRDLLAAVVGFVLGLVAALSDLGLNVDTSPLCGECVCDCAELSP